MTARVTALLAEDEPLLAASLRRMLTDAWPELTIVAEAADGESALVRALDATPDVLFLDVRMPGRTGLAVAEAVIDDWPDTRPAPLVVFVTAYDEFAVAAFDREAVDYVLKPATPARMARTVERLKQRLAARDAPPVEGDLAALLRRLQGLAHDGAPSGPGERLDAVHVGVGNHVHVIPVAEVLYFEATDKYVSVRTRDREGLIRMSMRELIARLDPAAFLQVHRGTVVNRAQVVAATRDDAGHVTLALRDTPRTIPVSRAFAHRFRAM